MEREQLIQLAITEPDRDIAAAIQKHWDQIAKPLDSMGQFESLACRIGAILEDETVDIGKKAVIVMCADNGIIAEGVSQSGSDVTKNVAASMGRGTSSVCKMAAAIGADVIPVNIGMCCGRTPEGVRDERVVNGTKNFAKEPAMTEQEVLAAIETGMNLVKDCKEQGYRILATGEMGIGNTTTSAAVAAALTGWDPELLTGRGAGLDDDGLSRKKQVIRKALDDYGFCRQGQTDSEEKRSTQTIPKQTSQEETLRVLSCVGGADIAGLAGVFLGGAVYHIPVVLDGLISAVAALAAESLAPGAKAYMVPSHASREPAAEKVLDLLGLKPVIRADLSLGEGTGAVMMFALLDEALVVYGEPATFSDIQIEQYKRYDS